MNILNDKNGFAALLVVSLLFCICIASKFMSKEPLTSSYKDEYTKKLKSILFQVLKWAHLAEQSKEPLIIMQSYSNSIAYLKSAFQLSNQETLNSIAGYNCFVLLEKLKKRHNNIFKSCVKEYDIKLMSDIPISGWLEN